MKIYTKTGDKGKTSLYDGNRVDKDDDLALLKKEGFDEEKNLELFDNNEDTSRDDSHHPIGEINKS